MRGTSRRRRKRSGGTRRRRGKKEQFTGDVKRSERRIFGNEVSSQRSQSRRRVTGRLIGVNRRGDESAITFLSTRIHSLSLFLSLQRSLRIALETRAEGMERTPSLSPAKSRTIIPRECSPLPNLAIPFFPAVFFRSPLHHTRSTADVSKLIVRPRHDKTTGLLCLPSCIHGAAIRNPGKCESNATYERGF